VYRFGDVYMVEVAARVCRTYRTDDPDEVEPAAAATANLIYKVRAGGFSLLADRN
jgi:hypothetical protein